MLGELSQATFTRMQRCLKLFAQWCATEVQLDLEQVLSSSEAADFALRGYGLALFRTGKPRYLLVHTITAVQQLRPQFRRQLSGARQVDHKWQMEEPGQCRAVLSAPVIRALICLSFLWKWPCFAGIVATGFEGMLRPNEFIELTRRDGTLCAPSAHQSR